MAVTLTRFLALLFAALALAPTLAHLLELPGKMDLARDEYLVVQQIYRGWSLLGVFVIAALASTLVLAWLVRQRRREFAWTLAAFACLAGTQLVFWLFTFPMNQQTDNWSFLPDLWTSLRAQWEYSHATSAGLNLLAFAALAWSAASRGRDPWLA